jgi:Protein of unknown function (DUF2950)
MSATLIWRGLLALACVAGLSVATWAQTPTTPNPAPQATSPQAEKPPRTLQGFATPEEAANTMTEALRKDDDKTIAAILGAAWRDLVPGTKEDEDETRDRYLKAWDENHKIVMSGDDKAQVEVGKTGFLMAIPIVKQDGAWRFDIEEGKKEIQARFIGRNEYRAIQTLLAIADAQNDYRQMDPMKTGLPVYARRLLSSPGNKDGLYWETAEGQPDSPLGPLVAKAQQGAKEGDGYYGYYYRLLYSQGPDAPGGAYSYLVDGRMLGGFAVIAWPMKYGETGVMTFMISHNSDVYEQDLGPDTAEKAGNISVFNPDTDWDKADMTPP